MKRKRPIDPTGLYLWEVDLTNATSSLWITTDEDDVVVASRKATAFLKQARRAGTYGLNVRVNSVTSRGFIDA